MSSSINLSDPAIPPGSLVLVTGVNGFIGSHVADQFLAAGYNVRGTARDISRHAWMTEFFSMRYSPGRFELVEVKDFTQNGCFDAAMQGASAVAHTTNHVELTATEPEPMISLAVQTVLTALESAKKVDGVKRFVFTSSAWAAAPSQPGREYKVDAGTWHDEILESIRREDKKHTSIEIFMAGKTKAEKEAWKWVEKNKPNFEFSAVLPDVVLGPVLSSEHQGIPSTAGLVQELYKGKTDFLLFVEPQWFSDVVDTAKLHVAACVDSTVKNERIIGYGEAFNWNDVLAVFRRAVPDGGFIEDLDLGRDLGQVDNTRGVGLLKKLYGIGWTSLDESIRANVASFTDSGAVSSIGWK
jgi:nucleoside-diphosphate-sugar epimerase